MQRIRYPLVEDISLGKLYEQCIHILATVQVAGIFVLVRATCVALPTCIHLPRPPWCISPGAMGVRVVPPAYS